MTPLFPKARRTERAAPPEPSGPPWTVLVVDDDPEVHAVTRLALGKVRFRNRPLTLLGAMSAAEARRVLADTPDVAVILLDVVMETEDAGLRLIREIREEMGNRAVRIILRTGQPGQAPEETVIVDYDINDYKAKTELTTQKLFTTTIAALRAYDDIVKLETNRRGLQQIIEISDDLFHLRSMQRFASAVLTQLGTFLGLPPCGMLCLQRAAATAGTPSDIRILAGTGGYEDLVQRPLDGDRLDAEVTAVILRTFNHRQSLFGPDFATLYIGGADEEHEVAVYLHSRHAPGDVDRTLLEAFASKIAVGFSNIRLNERLREANETLEAGVEERTRALEQANGALTQEIEERKQVQADLQRSNAELEQFSYAISHDLQEPLRMVTSYLQLLKRRYAGRLDAEADEFIGYAVDGARRMERMIKDLLDYSRVQRRGNPFAACEMAEALDGALANLKPMVESTGGTITWEPLPRVTADATQLLRLFQNLIGNALKYRSPDAAPVVHVAARADGDHWVVSVRDNGIGIDPAHFARLFQVFQRLHRRDEYEGSGVGLAVCRRIVERHGGRIWVESAPGQGSTFLFSLPKEPATRAS